MTKTGQMCPILLPLHPHQPTTRIITISLPFTQYTITYYLPYYVDEIYVILFYSNIFLKGSKVRPQQLPVPLQSGVYTGTYCTGTYTHIALFYPTYNKGEVAHFLYVPFIHLLL
jgi:hypothetical protein